MTIERALIGTADGSAAAVDPNFGNVSLLLHGDGTNGAQNNTFLDSSTNNFTITRNGNTTQGTFSPFNTTAAYSPSVNGGSGYFDGIGDALTLPSDSSLALGSGNFTVEAWMYWSSNNGNWALCSKAGDWFLTADANRWVYSANPGATNVFVINWTPTIGVWYHVACVRNGSTTTMYINGASIGSGTSATTQGAANPLIVGATSTGTFPFNGYISNLRIVKGTAVYTSNFTPPTSPLTAITNTSLLLNFTNAGIFDNAKKNDLETVGNAQISTSVKKYGTGSMYFDGSGDYLTAPSNAGFAFGTGDFTIEGWVYALSGINGERGFVQTSSTGLSTSYATGVVVGFKNTVSSFSWNVAGTTLIGGAAALNTWMHLAVTRQSGTVRAFVNGGQVVSGTATGDCSGTYIAVGGYYDLNYLWHGYIDDLRITKGVARYTANFTPPTQAFPDQ